MQNENQSLNAKAAELRVQVDELRVYVEELKATG
jgi:hypothetical protein